MKAAYIESTGGPEVIRYGDLPKPTPGNGEVLVRVGAVSVNPIDLYIRSGTVPMPLPKPFIIGSRSGRHGRSVGPGASALHGRRPRLGIEPGSARPAGDVRGVGGGAGRLALSARRTTCRTRQRRRRHWSASPRHLGLFDAPHHEGGRKRVRQRRHRRRRLDGRANGQGRRRPGHHDGRHAEKAELCRVLGRRLPC